MDNDLNSGVCESERLNACSNDPPDRAESIAHVAIRAVLRLVEKGVRPGFEEIDRIEGLHNVLGLVHEAVTGEWDLADFEAYSMMLVAQAEMLDDMVPNGKQVTAWRKALGR